MLETGNVSDVERLACFIASINGNKQQHVGYCGVKAEGILEDLKNDFSDIPLDYSFVAAYENGEMVGAVGVDIDKETKTAEIWGPFVHHADWEKVSMAMWKQLLKQLPISLDRAFGFYNIYNSRCAGFMEQLGAERKEREDVILQIIREEWKVSKEGIAGITEMTAEYFDAFRKLHQEAFPNGYYRADEIIEKLDDKNRVFLATESGTFAGYVYCEADPELCEADIHFISVCPDARNNGWGRKLISKSVDFLFSFKEINEIILCVDASNATAIRIYKNAGFTPLHQLAFFVLPLAAEE